MSPDTIDLASNSTGSTSFAPTSNGALPDDHCRLCRVIAITNSAWGALVDSISKGLIATVWVAVAACSPTGDLTAEGLQELRRDVPDSRVAFEQTASMLVPSPVRWANHIRVRYRVGADDRTENWDTAQVPQTIRAQLMDMMASHKVEAIFVNEQRVNFILRSSGIAPSGTAIGVVVAPGNEHGCEEISAPLKLDGRGLRCEKLGGMAYLYLHR